jgi:hypothetical protein
LARSVPKQRGQPVVGKKLSQMTPTKASELQPVPMAKFIIHGVTPVPWSLVFRRPTPLKTKPCPLWTLHITAPNTGLVVERIIDPTCVFMCSQVELRNNASNDLVIQTLRIFEGKLLETSSKVATPLTHDVVRGDFLGLRVVGSTSYDHVVGVGVPINVIQQCG